MCCFGRKCCSLPLSLSVTESSQWLCRKTRLWAWWGRKLISPPNQGEQTGQASLYHRSCPSQGLPSPSLSRPPQSTVISPHCRCLPEVRTPSLPVYPLVIVPALALPLLLVLLALFACSWCPRVFYMLLVVAVRCRGLPAVWVSGKTNSLWCTALPVPAFDLCVCWEPPSHLHLGIALSTFYADPAPPPTPLPPRQCCFFLGGGGGGVGFCSHKKKKKKMLFGC